jgi:hypothetical protein
MRKPGADPRRRFQNQRFMGSDTKAYFNPVTTYASDKTRL